MKIKQHVLTVDQFLNEQKNVSGKMLNESGRLDFIPPVENPDKINLNKKFIDQEVDKLLQQYAPIINTLTAEIVESFVKHNPDFYENNYSIEYLNKKLAQTTSDSGGRWNPSFSYGWSSTVNKHIKTEKTWHSTYFWETVCRTYFEYDISYTTGILNFNYSNLWFDANAECRTSNYKTYYEPEVSWTSKHKSEKTFLRDLEDWLKKQIKLGEIIKSDIQQQGNQGLGYTK
jgi:hypothetical protein